MSTVVPQVRSWDAASVRTMGQDPTHRSHLDITQGLTGEETGQPLYNAPAEPEVSLPLPLGLWEGRALDTGPAFMAKLISAHREVSIAGKAREYLRTHVVFPSALLGLILLIASTMGLGYQYLADAYDGSTFVQSTGLALVGALAGWGQCRYHRYLLIHYPESLASRLRAFSKKEQPKSRKHWPIVEAEHAGRKWVPLWYLAGVTLLVGGSFAAAAWGAVYVLSAYLLPWTGFFCARVYAWKELWGPTATPGSRL